MLGSRSRKLMKSQSAMEYLMTYGWAILIIAVVMGALFSLGIFSGYYLAPKAPPGACQIERNVESVSVQGECSNLIPQFVSEYAISGYTGLSQISQENGLDSISYSVWFKTLSLTTSWPMIFGDTEGSNGLNREGYDLFVCGPGCTATQGALELERFCGGGGNCGPLQSILPLSLNTWYLATVTYNGGTQTLSLYVNGVLQGTYLSNVAINVNSPMSIGAASDGWNPGAYEIANFQGYNISLDAGTVKQLYVEGIGGVPVEPQYTFLWVPLNGNPNDYSGSNNNGQNTAVSYIANWWNGYTQP